MLRHPLVISRDRKALGAGPGELVLGEIGDLGDADAVAHAQAFGLHMREVVGAMEGDDVLGLDALGREPQRRLEAPAVAHHRALRDHHVIERRRLLRPRRRQFLIGEADREAPRIILAHLRIGVGARRPFAEAGDVHRPDIEARDRH